MDSVQLSLFLKEEYVVVKCPYCGVTNTLSITLAKNFEQVHGCYVIRREGITTKEFAERMFRKK